MRTADRARPLSTAQPGTPFPTNAPDRQPIPGDPGRPKPAPSKRGFGRRRPETHEVQIHDVRTLKWFDRGSAQFTLFLIGISCIVASQWNLPLTEQTRALEAEFAEVEAKRDQMVEQRRLTGRHLEALTNDAFYMDLAVDRYLETWQQHSETLDSAKTAEKAPAGGDDEDEGEPVRPGR